MSRLFVTAKKKPSVLFLLLAMVIALTVVMATSASAAGTTIGYADFADGVYTITEGGDYRLAEDATGTIVINTDQPVKIIGNGISGTPNSGLTLDCVVAGADLTIEDLYIDAPVTDKNVINFTGIDNNLKISGESLLENSNTSMYYAAIHVPSDGSLTIDGKGTLYLYKRGLGAGIGGNCSTETNVGETNGDITIAGGTIFAKGSQSGATIGAGMKGTGGNVYITGGVLNLMTKGRAAVIGGGGETGGEHGPGGNVYISGGTLLLYTDWSGSQIGCGNGNKVYNDGGNVYISGGSIKTVITENACQFFDITPAQNTVSDAAITANKLNNDTDNEAVYQLIFDTSVLSSPAESFTVKVDGNVFYTGAGHKWKEGDPESSINGGAFAADNAENKLYFYVTGEDHLLTVNGEEFQATWDASTSTFTVEPASTGSDVWDGTADTSWYDAGNPLSAYTISTAEQLAGLACLVNDGNSFAGVKFTLVNDINLNSESSTTNWTPIGTASVTIGSNRQAIVDSKSPFAGIFDGNGFSINGLYISSDANMQGLFGCLTGEVKNLTLNGSITSTAAENDPYTNRCVGSVAAFNHGGTIADVINYVTVNAPQTYFVGGITGYNLEGTITRSANLAAVTGCQCVGGITGRNGGTITYTYNTGRVDGTNAISKNGVGGIAGKNGNHSLPIEKAIIDSCYNAGTVGREGQKWVGGIAGFQNGLSFTRNCYCSGTIIVGAGRYAPIIGQEEGTSTNNYSLDTLPYDTNETVIGIRLSDEELKAAAPLLGGAFVNDIGGGYPVLFWQSNLALYTITVAEDIEGGVVEAPARAVEDSEVIVTVTPDENYRLVPDSLTYTIAGEDPVVITAIDGVYSFIMPAADITINAAFEINPLALDLAKEAAKDELENYKDPADYRDAQKDELAAAVAAGKAAIDAATDIEGVNSALADAKAAIDKIKTDAQLTAEELEAAKEAAKDELENYKYPADYRDAQKDELAAAVAAGKAAIDAATDIEGVNSALTAAKAAIDKIKTDVQLTEEEEALEAAKKEAKQALENYKDPAKYRAAQRAELEAAIERGKAAIDAATDIDGVEKALTEAKATIDKIKTDAELIVEEEKEEDTPGVKTGDAFPMAIQLVLFSIGLIGVACLLMRKRHTA